MMTVMAKDPRSPAQIREHYEIEKELALRLRTASYTQRQGLYSQVYDELFRRVPHHMQLTVGASEARAAARMEEAEYELYGLEPYLKAHTIFAEIGAGDCAITMAVAARVKHAYAIDVSTEVTKGLSPPDNFTLLISDGRNIPVTPGTIHVAFSTQLMEHLHPEDAGEQLSSIYRSLAPGGIYLCVTPNRVSGPHDISRAFDDTATGLHLKEYSARELTVLFRQVGFNTVKAHLRLRMIRRTIPTWTVVALESALQGLPQTLRKNIASKRGISHVLGVRLLGIKSA